MRRIVTERLLIERATEDVAEMITQSNEGTSAPFSYRIPETTPLTKKDMAALVALYHTLQSSSQLPRDVYSVKLNAGELAGYIALRNPAGRVPEIQLELLKKWQNLGYGQELLRGFTAAVFMEGHVDAILYRVHPDNLPSIKIVERVGAQLQEPESEVEALLIRTYLIRRPPE